SRSAKLPYSCVQKMENMLSRYMLFLIMLAHVLSCRDDDTNAKYIPMTVIAVDSVGINSNGNHITDYCPDGIYSQILRGGQVSNSPIYTVEFGTDLPLSTHIKSVSILLIGNDGYSDTLFQDRVSVYNNVSDFLLGGNNIVSRIKLVAHQNGNEYISVNYNFLDQDFTILDENADYNIEFVVFDEEPVCNNNDYVLIESKLFYNGYLYNILDSNDSIKVVNFEGVIYNTSN
ncbi:hypothetical protein CEQ90_20530, partial [Lewinellaceae bacterium SD302]